jgi:FtsP/CotA-like multicopper oxidase with cupredoxin domain
MASQYVHSSVLQPARRRSIRVRQLISALAAVIAVAAIAGTIVSSWPKAAANYEPQTREFTLTASEFDWEIQPGNTVRAWGYNQQVPGPEIRVKEGDLVRVTLQNELPVATTIHWHGLMVPPEMDGPAGLSQAPLEPGETFVYEFIAKPAGTRMYHSHTDVVNQIQLGLYGAFIVEPAEAKTTYDQEFTYTIAEWDMEMTPRVAQGLDPRGPRDSQLRGGELGADLFLMNGHTHEAIPPITVDEGDKVLIRLINMGNMGHPIHLHGHLFKIVATDGNPVPKGAQLTKDTVWIAPGERYDIELTADNPGIWMVHCHIENHAANGMMTLIEYEGEVPTGPLAEVWNTEAGQAPAMDHSAHGAPATTPEPTTEPEPTESTMESTPIAEAPPADGAVVSMVDDRFGPKSLEVKAGTTVTFVNNGSNWHSVAAVDGSFTSAQLKSGDAFAVTFDTPGTYKYICRHHARAGMIGTIVVTE